MMEILELKERYVPFFPEARIKECSRGGYMAIHLHLNQMENFESIDKIDLKTWLPLYHEGDQQCPAMILLPKHRPKNLPPMSLCPNLFELNNDPQVTIYKVRSIVFFQVD